MSEDKEMTWGDMKATDWRATDNPDVVTDYNGKLLARAIADGHDVYFRLPGSLDNGEIRFGTPDLEWEDKTVHMAVSRRIEV